MALCKKKEFCHNFTMDVLLVAQQYINEMVRLAGPGMKAILMDKETTSCVSCAYAQSEMMQKEAYLFERLDSVTTRGPIKFLKCVVFVRPTPENVQLLSEELLSPKYSQYYIYFSNRIPKADVKILAESDEQETVRELREIFVVFHSTGAAFGIVKHSHGLRSAAIWHFHHDLSAMYQKTSRDAKRLAEEFVKVTSQEDALFERCKTDSVLVVLDRSEDPISPLLNQWTYEAMVHELIGLSNNRVTMENVGSDGQKNIVLNAQYDEFYAKNMYLNFGDIGQNIKGLMNEYQRKAQTHQQLESIADMKKFVEQYPQFKKISGTVAKHVQLVGELSRMVTDCNLLEISELEQNIAVANGDHSACLESLRRLLQHSKTTDLNALRLVMLFSLRFEGNNSVLSSAQELLRQRGLSNRQLQLVRTLLEYAGQKRRQSDLFGNRSAMEMTKRFIKGLKGVENIFTQHEPHIVQLVDLVSRGKLPESAYPSTDLANINVILFIIGGATFEESAAVANLNAKRSISPSSHPSLYQGNLPPRVILCSTFVHNTKSFVAQLAHYSSAIAVAGGNAIGTGDLSAIL
uniref:Vacuolar protein sorting-associated protein 45 n=1 Tax=Globodera pallida TaxID=36090 RepID=A0A183CBE5_GLOPA